MAHESETAASPGQPPARRATTRPADHPRPMPDPAGARTQPCPACGHPMPDLKGGSQSICAVCGFKDSCCY